MDKYTKQSQKANLRARRRNSTADLQLQGRVRYLERHLAQMFKQNMRDKFRLQEDVRELSEVSDYLEGGQLSARPSSRNINITSACLSNNGRLLSRGISPNTRKDQEITKISRDFKDNTMFSDYVDDHDLVAYHDGTRDTIDPPTKIRDIHDKSRCLEHSKRTLGHNSALRSCKYSPGTEYCRKSPCIHYPCSVPATYHALGFRRDDAKTWTFNDRPGRDQDSYDIFCKGLTQNSKNKNTKLTSKETDCLDENESKIKISQRKRPKVSKSPCLSLSSLENYNPDTDLNLSVSESTPRWNRDKQPTRTTMNFRFRPGSGPAFGHKPRDLVLERVRMGTSKAVSSGRLAVRSTVAGRIRGLGALIGDMRSEHESKKPVDWAVNYGQRLPMRMLLNPVVPL